MPIIKGPEGGDPASVVFDAVKAATDKGTDALIVDTAGRLQNKRELMEELAKIRRVLGRLNPEAPHDVVLVPKGHHPCGAPYGYEMYYLNVMAGPRRNWRFANDPDHDWIYRRDNPQT